MAVVTIPYKPRPEQRIEHNAHKRFNVLVAHRRWGKTVYAINELMKNVIPCRHKNPRGAYFAPLYKQAKNIAWDYLKEFSRGIPGVTFNEAELRADYPNGARIMLYGSDNPDAIRGIYLDYCVLDEVAQMPARLFTEIIRPALADRQGGCLMIGTPQGRNQFYNYYEMAGGKPDWHRAMHPASTSGVLPKKELDAARELMSGREYEQEFELSWSAAIRGAFYGAEMSKASQDGRIGLVPYDKAHRVITAWDLGIRDKTAVWFIQACGNRYHAIDYEDYENVGLPDIIKHISTKPYTYVQHIAPPDIKVRELGSGQTRKHIARQLGVNFTHLKSIPSVEDGIEAVRSMLGRFWFDQEHCQDGIEALIQYRNELDDKKGLFKPRHDWTSHAADAMRYFCTTPLQSEEWTDIDYTERYRSTG